MAIRIFEHPLSPYARKVKLLLYEKGIPFERVQVDPLRPGRDRDDQEFVLASPRHEVPCLIDGRTRIFDSRVIADYLDDRWPEPPMLPPSPDERARVRMLETICDGPLDAVLWGLMEVEVFRRAEGELAANLRAQASDQLVRFWSWLERGLEGRPFLNGERFGRGDAAALPHLGGPPTSGIRLPERFATLRAWIARCAERGSVRREAAEAAEAAQRIGRAEPGPTAPRTYRDHRLEWMIKSGGLEVVARGLEAGTIRFAPEV